MECGRDRKFADSALEEGGFELSVPGGKFGVNSDRGLTPLNPDDATGILRGLRAGGSRS